MDTEEKILQEYILYVQHQENFVNRSFSANRFYLIAVLAVLFVTVPVKLLPFAFGIVFTMLFSLIGILLCILWYLNIDAYKNLLKIKLQNVIEKLEDSLPVKPYQMESAALKEARDGKKKMIFGDMQKTLAIIIMVAFITVFLNETMLLFIM